MSITEVISLISQLIETHRVEVGYRPKVTPITWEGIDMTVEEAKEAIHLLEGEKKRCQKSMNNTQAGGDITKLAVGGAGLATMVTGAALMLFPPTAIAGAITLASGVGATGVGQVVGEGVKDIGTSTNVQEIQQLNAYISSLKNAIRAST